ncbi:Hypothetical predicted protein [Pelobates cultripes]|uniref:Uncharacterized protein n=1 Tax=Pelobates cultripes TaxID=61616 RepID=A0AAD1RRM5_PELCU|nr:Hypothetical predicted protein [Pelobates cultripes]
MAGFLHTTSPTSPVGSKLPALDRIGEELRNMAAAMATKADLQLLKSTIQEVVRAEVASLRTKVAAQEGRIHTLEHSAEAQSARFAASDSVVACQAMECCFP